jgi:hypothetical protein
MIRWKANGAGAFYSRKETQGEVMKWSYHLRTGPSSS